MSNDFFDFGFTAVNEEELEAVQQAQNTATTVASDLQERIDKLYESVLPLLANLKQNPERDYIYWPNRVEKVEQFEAHLKSIYEG